MEYRFKDEEERTPVYHIINTTFPVLLEILNHLLALPNPSIEVADLIKLILKIFWSSAYVSDVNHMNLLLCWFLLFVSRRRFSTRIFVCFYLFIVPVFDSYLNSNSLIVGVIKFCS